MALSAASIGRALFTEGAIRLIRREIRREEGLLIDPEDLATSLHNMLSTESREEIGPMKIRKRRKPRKRRVSKPLAIPIAAPEVAIPIMTTKRPPEDEASR